MHRDIELILCSRNPVQENSSCNQHRTRPSQKRAYDGADGLGCRKVPPFRREKFARRPVHDRY
jgi:hypothetical protein